MNNGTTFEQFKASLPENIRSDRRQLLAVAKAAGVEVPYSERFYTLTHTPRKTKSNENPQPTEYVSVPSPTSSKDLWVQKSELAKFLNNLQEFVEREGLTER